MEVAGVIEGYTVRLNAQALDLNDTVMVQVTLDSHSDNTLEKFGPVRSVKPTMVFELGFEGINRSSRHKSGIAVRFPRMLRIRHDKPLHEANSLADLERLLDL